MRTPYFVFAALLLAVGCSSSQKPNGQTVSPASSLPIADGLTLPPGTTALLSIQASASPNQSLTADTPAGPLSITAATMNLQKIQLRSTEMRQEASIQCAGTVKSNGNETETECEDAAESEIANTPKTQMDGPFDVDLERRDVRDSGTSNIEDTHANAGPDGTSEIVDALPLPAGTYVEVDAEIHGLAIEGSLNGQPFQLTDDTIASLKAENAGGIAVSGAAVQSLVMTFNPAGWLSGVDLSTAEKNPDGVVVIDQDHNAPLLAIVAADVASSASLHNDANGDGIEDDTE